MLKVVGASWLQTRISTYILIAVALLGVGAIILGEFGHIEQDGIYSATVSWNYKGGYRIDFLGQGNDLTAVPLHAARAYYKTGIFESGWSYIEIETSSKYSDEVQAYAAGLLEGSLTWQLIHHHWYNTVKPVCEEKAAECRKLSRYLRDNSVVIRERAQLLESTDPFWHMVLLFYAQLDGLEAGWKFAVRRSRQSVSMETEDFLWLALASDLAGFERTFNISNAQVGSRVLLKVLPRDDLEPLIAIGHNTAASYSQMLRLVKKYTFGYHVLPTPKTTALVPTLSLIMSSYPGALSSQDEFYVIKGKNRELIITGTALQMNNQSQWAFLYSKDHVMLSMRVMAANRLAIDGQTWFETLSHQNGGASALQWIAFEPRTTSVLLVEQLPSVTATINYSEEFQKVGFIAQNGVSNFDKIQDIVQPSKEDPNFWRNRVARLQENVTTLEQFQNLMRGCSQEEFNKDQNLTFQSDLPRKFLNRGDLEDMPLPFGIIDTKILVVDTDGIETFEATSGPVTTESCRPFKWSETFPNISHIGQPDVFEFDSVTPLWVWT